MDKKRAKDLHEIGCIVCRLHYGIWSEPEIHHLKGYQWSSMGKRANDQHTIPLCPIHHRHGAKAHVGYHQLPGRFEDFYGSQEYLLEQTNKLIKG